MALGELIIRSKKAKRDITDDAWSRYANNDDNLPDWFVQDERRHNQKQLPITKVRHSSSTKPGPMLTNVRRLIETGFQKKKPAGSSGRT